MRPLRNTLTTGAVIALVVGLTATAAPAQAAMPAAAAPSAGARCAAGTLSVQTLRTGCTVSSGTVALPDGRTFAVPAPGESVMASSSAVPGAAELAEVVIANTGGGGVAVRIDESWSGSAPAVRQEQARSAAASAAAAAPTAAAASTKCTSTAYELNPYRWSSTVQWYYNQSGQKSTYAKDALRKAANAWTGTISSCDRTVNSTARNAYVRLATQAPGLTDKGGCAKSNGYSVVGWGKLPSGTLGVTCVWYDSNGIAKESDQRYATSYKWSSTDTCSGARYDTQAVATHEWGHLYGLGHVKTGTGQVMEPSGGTCDTGSRTLGLGDLTGIGKIY
ncbi:matrixin family metalloprotease [Curtobacterium sp. VKM Ac-1393]|uniref:matrixin family metalloprotease n=1 Tax=Curtobacterium sp. VKM Ac-1393 TaxID=2783814 RepID=UPI00188B3831|nr:matrixin family metalloprotease [Curtobacterium sp. VKM Ac-1393]MBF4608198.1 matrixin family metalloprotease [Curtobacterium sp. VKM Ac-1393]